MARKGDYITTGAIAKVVGVHIKTVNAWIAKRIIRPEFFGTGTGNDHRYSTLNVLAIQIGTDLRHRGFSLQHSNYVMQWLAAHTIDELREQWSRGRRYLVAAGGSVLQQRLFSDNEAFTAAAAAHELAGGVPVTVLNVEAAYDGIQKRLAELGVRDDQTTQREGANLERSKLAEDEANKNGRTDGTNRHAAVFGGELRKPPECMECTRTANGRQHLGGTDAETLGAELALGEVRTPSTNRCGDN